MEGVGPTFCGFTINGIKKEAVLVHTLYLHKKMALLNIHCTWELIFYLKIHQQFLQIHYVSILP